MAVINSSVRLVERTSAWTGGGSQGRGLEEGLNTDW